MKLAKCDLCGKVNAAESMNQIEFKLAKWEDYRPQVLYLGQESEIIRKTTYDLCEECTMKAMEPYMKSKMLPSCHTERQRRFQRQTESKEKR